MPRKTKTKRPNLGNDGDRLSKKARFLGESASEDETEFKLSVNEEYAKRFEHNKKREEFQKLQERYGKDDEESEESDSEDESEDEVGEFATDQVDAEIANTITAIKSKDPRIYDQNFKFYSDFDPDASEKSAKDKPMYLRDYHRQSLLSKDSLENAREANNDDSLPYAREQQVLRESFLKATNGADENGDEDDFLVRKSHPEKSDNITRVAPPDPSIADKDPELFLSNLMSSKAWVPVGPATLQPFDSDDSEEEDQADEFETAWNMRFEDPENANTVLMTHSRALVAKTSVRNGEEKTARQRVRDKERELKEEKRAQRERERGRLKKLKMDDISEKLERIRENAGMFDGDEHGDIDLAEWKDLLEGDWNDEQFDQEMQKRFDEAYYAQETLSGKRKEPKKPKWDDDDDIEVGDIVSAESDNDDSDGNINVKEELSKTAKAKISSSKRKRDQRLISALAENALDVPDPEPGSFFRYRDTSPTSFGMTALDILTASDAQLNTFAGLKKLAAWRDPERKQKERKKLGKKARLRKWRAETFGDEEGPKADSWEKREAIKDEANIDDGDDTKTLAKKKAKKRRRGSKKSAGETEA